MLLKMLECSPAVRQSGSPAVRQSGSPAVRQSGIL